jgi:hypothetical protein
MSSAVVDLKLEVVVRRRGRGNRLAWLAGNLPVSDPLRPFLFLLSGFSIKYAVPFLFLLSTHHSQKE